ncbi:MAG TPA: ABC transporter permease [Spirochaetia bacterium]|nr:ABC transporter permease [Spirochaetales bacterium]HRY78778.1 ABC transporter permease [Spirochaetia bacterium]
MMRRIYAGRPHTVVLRALYALKTSAWFVVVSGFFEPVFYLLAFGLGLGTLVGEVTGPLGRPVSYAAFLAPALLATSAMNGAIYDSTWNVFFKMRFARLYEGMIATSLGTLDIALGEILYALLRGLVYALAFLAVMVALGLVPSAWGILAVPASLLIAFGFSACGMALTSYMTTFQQMDWINFFMLPMFLFSATFYPITVYPEYIRWIIQAFPLWHGIELIRGLTLGQFDGSILRHVLYFAAMIAVGLAATTRRLTNLFMK